jgi:hypothetical protein
LVGRTPFGGAFVLSHVSTILTPTVRKIFLPEIWSFSFTTVVLGLLLDLGLEFLIQNPL